MSNRNITNKFLGKIGNSHFHWDTPYYVKDVPSDLFPEDKSFLTAAFGYDGVPKKCMSFWLSNYSWEWIDEQHDYEIHYHCYPDDGNECYNPVIRLPEDMSNIEKVKILVDFLEENAIGVNKEVIEKRIEKSQKEIDKIQNNINIYKTILQENG